MKITHDWIDWKTSNSGVRNEVVASENDVNSSDNEPCDNESNDVDDTTGLENIFDGDDDEELQHARNNLRLKNDYHGHKQFRVALDDYDIFSHMQLVYKKNEKKRVRARCVQGYPSKRPKMSTRALLCYTTKGSHRVG
ncbi:hypothetical protein ACFE04_017967 [Oxalis oulophora]